MFETFGGNKEVFRPKYMLHDFYCRIPCASLHLWSILHTPRCDSASSNAFIYCFTHHPSAFKLRFSVSNDSVLFLVFGNLMTRLKNFWKIIYDIFFESKLQKKCISFIFFICALPRDRRFCLQFAIFIIDCSRFARFKFHFRFRLHCKRFVSSLIA